MNLSILILLIIGLGILAQATNTDLANNTNFLLLLFLVLALFSSNNNQCCSFAQRSFI